MNCLNMDSASNRSFVVLAPGNETFNASRRRATVSAATHERLLSEMQRLRGGIYFADGALRESDLDSEGRHIQAADSRSWHLLGLNAQGEVISCIRMRRHFMPTSWSQLGVRDAQIAQSEQFGFSFRAALDSEVTAARRQGLNYVEIGGWALAQEVRNSSMALKTVLAAFAWSELQGGALGVTTATQRNGSAGILRRLGGRPLMWDGAELPPYFDNRYQCQMEVLRFDSRESNSKYRLMMKEVREAIANAPVISAGEPAVNPGCMEVPMLQTRIA